MLLENLINGIELNASLDHCGSQTSSTLTLEFFSTISENMWENE